METQLKTRIDFLENWNGKLFCNAFSTIRLRDDEKYQVGNKYDITLREQFFGDAECVQVTHFTLDKMTESMAYIDTGFCKRDALELFKLLYGEQIINQVFTYVLLIRITKDATLNKRLDAYKSFKHAAISG